MRRSWYAAAAAAGALLAPSLAAAQPSTAALLTRIDSVANAALADGPLAGLAIGVMKGNQVLVAKGYGYADLEHRTPVNAETIFRVGSVTKQFTALALLQLAERGKLSLNDDLSTYVPSYPMRGRRIPLWMLLTHTSGIKNYTELGAGYMRDTFRLDLTPEAMVARFRDRPDDFAPGADFSYSNSPFFLAGMVVEKVSGMSYAQYLQHHILTPLGLRRTSYCSDETIVPNEAKGYEASPQGLRNAAFLSMTVPYAAGALCSSVLDLLAYQRALLDARIVSRASLLRMTTPPRLNDGWRTGYGYGLALNDDFGGLGRIVGHGGQINGFWVNLFTAVDRDLTVVVLSNVNPAGGAGVWSLSADIARAAAGLPVKASLIARPLPRTLAKSFAGNFTAAKIPFAIIERDGALLLGGLSEPPVPLTYVGHNTLRSAASSLLRIRMERDPRTGAWDAVRLMIPELPMDMRGRRVKGG